MNCAAFSRLVIAAQIAALDALMVTCASTIMVLTENTTDFAMVASGFWFAGKKAVLKHAHSKRFATAMRLATRDSVWSACVFSAAFVSQQLP
jgi:hypothetical protein